LQREFDAANAILDEVEKALGSVPPHVRVRYLLERGRALNSSGEASRAVPLFSEALKLAEREGDEFYAIDAAHMLGIAAPQPERLDWDLKALSLAEQARDPRARDWRASLYHNIGWAYFEAGNPSTALEYWQKALALRITMGRPGPVRVAKWTVARGLRAIGRIDDAEKIQVALLAELDAIGEADGYVYEELAELALARGDVGSARSSAARAHEALQRDPRFVATEAPRLERLAAIASGQLPPRQP